MFTIDYVHLHKCFKKSNTWLPFPKCSQRKCRHHFAWRKHQTLIVLLLEATSDHFCTISLTEWQKNFQSFISLPEVRKYLINIWHTQHVSQISSNNTTCTKCSQMQAACWLMGNCTTVNKTPYIVLQCVKRAKLHLTFHFNFPIVGIKG